MAKVVFEVDDDLTAVSGIAVIHCIDEDGDTAIQTVQFGSLHVYQAMGLLTGALETSKDQWREDQEEE